MVLLALNALVAALTCGDDGALDYGTASAGEERLCRASFDTHLDGSEHFGRKVTILGLIALGAILVTGTLLAFTGRRGWLVASLGVLVALAAWTLLFVSPCSAGQLNAHEISSRSRISFPWSSPVRAKP